MNVDLSLAMLQSAEERIVALEKQWRHLDKRIAALEALHDDAVNRIMSWIKGQLNI